MALAKPRKQRSYPKRSALLVAAIATLALTLALPASALAQAIPFGTVVYPADCSEVPIVLSGGEMYFQHLDGAYDESEAANSFQDALREWRSGGAATVEAPAPAPAASGLVSSEEGTQSMPVRIPARPASAQRSSYFMRLRMREEAKAVGEAAAAKVAKEPTAGAAV